MKSRSWQQAAELDYDNHPDDEGNYITPHPDRDCEEFIILVNTGRRVLSFPEMEQLMRQCGATTWYQASTPQTFDVEEALDLSQDIVGLCQGDLTGREL